MDEGRDQAGGINRRHAAGWIFGVAACFNALVGTALLVARPHLSAMLDLDPVNGTNLVAANMVGGFVLLFGLLYLLVALRPGAYRNVVAPMIAGKLVAVAAATLPWLQGEIGPQLSLLTLPDLFFAAAFGVYLARTRR